MDTPTPAFGRESPPPRRLTRAVPLLTVALAGAAMAAPCVHDDCRNAPRDLEGPRVTLCDLALRTVDLGDADTAADPADTAALSESMAPLLYLTPRVASILEAVFDDSVPAEAAGEEAARTAPVAEAAPPEDDPERYGPLSHADTAFDLPKFQRQMYRTDI